MSSVSSSSRLAAKSVPMRLWPVTFPPGRARLATSPSARGSAKTAKTIGIVAVACLAARAPGPAVTSTSTGSCTNSVARASSRSSWLSPDRYSIRMFCPSTYPRSRSPCRKGSQNGLGSIVSGTNFAGPFCACFACQNRGFRGWFSGLGGVFGVPKSTFSGFHLGGEATLPPLTPSKSLGITSRPTVSNASASRKKWVTPINRSLKR